MHYTIDIKGMKRDLPLCKVNDNLFIGAFVMFGDVEITKHAACELLKLAPPHDIMITAESKGLPLLYEMARQNNENDYVLARKGPKLYMENILTVEVNSITTDHKQSLCVSGDEVEKMKGKNVLIIDDVISTGESLHALCKLVEAAGGNIVGKMAVLAEGDAIGRDDITYLAPLPLFTPEGKAL